MEQLQLRIFTVVAYIYSSLELYFMHEKSRRVRVLEMIQIQPKNRLYATMD